MWLGWVHFTCRFWLTGWVPFARRLPYIVSEQEAVQFQAQLEARREFEEGFKRSRKGNLWRVYNQRTISVFKHIDDCYRWSIADELGLRFSQVSYPTEEDAMDALTECMLG